MSLWIITVNFGDTKATKVLIESLSIIDNFDSIIVGIADNAASKLSSDQLKKIVSETNLEVKIFPFKKNIYYWPAAKRVINSLKSSIGSYPNWIIVCNNDVTFLDKNFFRDLSKIDSEKYPIIGPNIINSKGKQLNPFMFSSLSIMEKLYWKIYFISYPISVIMLSIKKWFSKLKSRSNLADSDLIKEVYAVHGSAIIFSGYFFERGGWLDDNFEMYGEELTLAEIAKTLNFPISYFPQLKIIHNEHNSTEKIDKRMLFKIAKKTHKYFISNYII